MEEFLLIEPRRSKVVVEEYIPKEHNKLILDIEETKKDTKLYSYKILAVGPAEDCIDLAVGSIVLCMPSDLQEFTYNGRVYYTVDSDFIFGFAHI